MIKRKIMEPKQVRRSNMSVVFFIDSVFEKVKNDILATLDISGVPLVKNS